MTVNRRSKATLNPLIVRSGATKRKNHTGVLALGLVLVFSGTMSCDVAAQTERLSPARNSASQRYEINQTFDGQAYRKDNNIWVYTKEFADLFGMPSKYIEDVQGIAAAAFRIEDTSFQQCGFGGNADACRKVEECLLDLYFDESKNPLPWVTDIKSQWEPAYSSMIWLRPLGGRAERPNGTLAVDPPPGVIRNKVLISAIVPFADPVSRVQAIFTSNRGDPAAKEEDVAGGSLPLIGYMRDFYRTLSVVSLQFGCMTTSRKDINVRLDSKLEGPYEPPLARFNRLYLPPGFVERINARMKERSDRNAIFYRSLFPPPLGTKGTASAGPSNH